MTLGVSLSLCWIAFWGDIFEGPFDWFVCYHVDLGRVSAVVFACMYRGEVRFDGSVSLKGYRFGFFSAMERLSEGPEVLNYICRVCTPCLNSVKPLLPFLV